jgi:hypothetical protein
MQHVITKFGRIMILCTCFILRCKIKHLDIKIFDFYMYDNQQRKTYASKYSIRSHSFVEIDIDGLPPNIIFSISRNENNSVYYERNDERGTRVWICDNHMARIGYRGFYTRMTMDWENLGSPITPSSSLIGDGVGSGIGLPPLEQTDIEEEQIKNSKSFLSLESLKQSF